MSATATTSRAANSTLSIPASAPAGVLTITQPPQTTIAFFKIAASQQITFAWNFTDVISTPASLTVSAICENGNTFPVGPTDGVIPGSATSVVWDAYAWQQSNPNSPLAQATYTLLIHDERGVDPSRAPGLLQPNEACKFGLYSPQPYTPISSGWNCPNCQSGALPTAHPAFFCVCLTIFVMFASGFAILRNSAR
ncbi:hypothetical protein BC826DRAFT_1046211 [Russula brevipes]|nr:hypothetical protein BC826DRAFT_1046211 [Russula brevipes]